jgi:hypothetical protein
MSIVPIRPPTRNRLFLNGNERREMRDPVRLDGVDFDAPSADHNAGELESVQVMTPPETSATNL